MSLINCEITLILTWSENWFIVASIAPNQEPTFAITDTKLDAPLETLSNEDKLKLLQKLESGFGRTINWNKYQPKIIMKIMHTEIATIDIFIQL